MDAAKEFSEWLTHNTPFRGDLKVLDPSGAVSFYINPNWVATDEAAGYLSVVLSQAGYPNSLVQGPPLPYPAESGGWKQVGTAPWIQFTDGAKVNAGLTIDQYWVRGPNGGPLGGPENAIARTVADIRLHQAAHAAGEE